MPLPQQVAAGKGHPRRACFLLLSGIHSHVHSLGTALPAVTKGAPLRPAVPKEVHAGLLSWEGLCTLACDLWPMVVRDGDGC